MINLFLVLFLIGLTLAAGYLLRQLYKEAESPVIEEPTVIEPPRNKIHYERMNRKLDEPEIEPVAKMSPAKKPRKPKQKKK